MRENLMSFMEDIPLIVGGEVNVLAEMSPIIGIVIIVLAIKLSLPMIPATIAYNKGYGKLGFYILGAFSFIIALIIALCLDNKYRVQNYQIMNNNTSADEIKKYKELYEQGIITEEEFQKKKTELINN